tara:strand:+ start:53 stop:229 length:177 start_codon:yes stop_codon:yes gene_type:complete
MNSLILNNKNVFQKNRIINGKKQPGKEIPGIGKEKSNYLSFVIIIFYYNLIGIKYLIR